MPRVSSRFVAPVACLATALLACSADKGPTTDDDDLIGGSTEVIGSKATFTILEGCTAAKVGRNVVLTAAHCVAGKEDRYAPGKPLWIVSPHIPPRPGSEAQPTQTRFVLIDRLEVEPKRQAGCLDRCQSIRVRRGIETADVAVIVTREPLDFIPVTAKVDLDRVVTGDELLVVGSGCEDFVWQKDFTHSRRRLKGQKTRVLDSANAFHPGSHMNEFGDRDETRATLDSSYFLTPGPDFERGAAGLCPGDSGGPVYRADAPDVVVGVNASYTFTDYRIERPVPMTNVHTRLDVDTKERVAQWLTSLGVETTHSCETRRCKTAPPPAPLPPLAGVGATDAGTD